MPRILAMSRSVQQLSTKNYQHRKSHDPLSGRFKLKTTLEYVDQPFQNDGHRLNTALNLESGQQSFNDNDFSARQFIRVSCKSIDRQVIVNEQRELLQMSH